MPKHRVITINITNSVAIGMRRCNSALVLAAQRQPAAGMACAIKNVTMVVKHHHAIHARRPQNKPNNHDYKVMQSWDPVSVIQPAAP